MKKGIAFLTALSLTLTFSVTALAGETSEGVMTHDEYVAAELETEVTVETYVQAKQSWLEDKATVYSQNEDGAYFLYNMACSEEDYEKLVPGTKIKVTGYKAEWSGEVEIIDATFEILEGEEYIAPVTDVTELLGKDELIEHQNEFVAFKGMTVEAAGQDENGNDVAFLMKSCGYASKMNYSPYGSGATTPDGVTALKTYFGYNPSLYAADRTYYGIDDWEALIYDNLAECGPVLYTGANFEGNEGHAFVCDGYSSDGFFHFNWGWGGMCDGYFRLTALNPDAVGIGGGSGLGFNFYQDAILGIQPEATPARTPNLSQGGNLVLSLDGNILYLSCENGVNNGFFNTTGATINGQIGIMLENQEGYTEYFWNTQTLAINYLSGYSQYGIRLPSLDNGVYKVYPAFKASGAAEGTRMEQQIAYTDFGYLTVSASGYSVSAPSAGTLTVTGVSNPSGFYIGHSFQVNATLTNSGESEFYGPVAVGLAKRSGTQLQLAAHGTIELLDLRAGESADKEFFSSLTATSALSAGEYIMLIFNPETGQVYYSESCTLNADPGTPALRATSFTVNGNASGVNARELSFAATVECTAGYFSDNLIVNLFERTGTGFQFDYVDSFNSAPVFITSGQNQNLNLAYDFVGGKVGTTYIAQLVYVRNNAEQQLAQADFTIGSSESGIEAVAADGTGAEAEYFDLTGRRISDPQPGHIYLRRTAGNVEKVIF